MKKYKFIITTLFFICSLFATGFFVGQKYFIKASPEKTATQKIEEDKLNIFINNLISCIDPFYDRDRVRGQTISLELFLNSKGEIKTVKYAMEEFKETDPYFAYALEVVKQALDRCAPYEVYIDPEKEERKVEASISFDAD